jgi:hypothetical protein
MRIPGADVSDGNQSIRIQLLRQVLSSLIIDRVLKEFQVSSLSRGVFRAQEQNWKNAHVTLEVDKIRTWLAERLTGIEARLEIRDKVGFQKNSS